MGTIEKLNVSPKERYIPITSHEHIFILGQLNAMQQQEDVMAANRKNLPMVGWVAALNGVKHMINQIMTIEQEYTTNALTKAGIVIENNADVGIIKTNGEFEIVYKEPENKVIKLYS